MTARAALHQYTRVGRHLTSARAPEVLALQASPLLGMTLSGVRLEPGTCVQAALLLLGSLALTAHVFVFNDWAGHRTDLNDPRRAAWVFGRDISRNQLAFASTVLLVLANFALLAVGGRAQLLGLAIATLNILYSWSAGFGKGTPIVASLQHLLGGSLHFLLGYTLVRQPDLRGLLISLFFGLVFTAGHLNQEVRDRDADSRNRIRTNAVVFGSRRTFLASLATFTAAYGLLVSLAACGLLPRVLLASMLLWPVHVAWSLRALRRGLGFDTSEWIQRRYRFLFALIGLGMLFG